MLVSKKRFYAFGIGAALAITLAGCNSDVDPKEEQETVVEEANKSNLDEKEKNEVESNEVIKEVPVAEEDDIVPSEDVVGAGESEITAPDESVQKVIGVPDSTDAKKPSTEQVQQQKETPISCSKPSTDTVHVVQTGDTLSEISLKHNLSIEELKSMNELTSNVIYTCQELIFKEEAAQENQEIETEEQTAEEVKKEDSIENTESEGDLEESSQEDELPAESEDTAPEEVVDPFAFTIHPFKVTNENDDNAVMTGTGKPGYWVFLNEVRLESLLPNKYPEHDIFYMRSPWEEMGYKVKVGEDGKWSFDWTNYLTYEGYLSGYTSAITTATLSMSPTPNEEDRNQWGYLYPNEEDLENITIEFEIETVSEFPEPEPVTSDDPFAFAINPLKITSDIPSEAILSGRGTPGEWVFLNEIQIYSPSSFPFHVDYTWWPWEHMTKTKVDDDGNWKVDVSVIVNRGITDGVAQAKVTMTPSSNQSEFKNRTTVIEIDVTSTKEQRQEDGVLDPLIVRVPKEIQNENIKPISVNGTASVGSEVYLYSVNGGEWYDPDTTKNYLYHAIADENGNFNLLLPSGSTDNEVTNEYVLMSKWAETEAADYDSFVYSEPFTLTIDNYFDGSVMMKEQNGVRIDTEGESGLTFYTSNDHIKKIKFTYTQYDYQKEGEFLPGTIEKTHTYNLDGTSKEVKVWLDLSIFNDGMIYVDPIITDIGGNEGWSNTVEPFQIYKDTE